MLVQSILAQIFHVKWRNRWVKRNFLSSGVYFNSYVYIYTYLFNSLVHVFFPREAWVWPFYSSQVVYSLGETTLAGVWWFNGHTPVNVPLQSSLLLGRATWSKWDYMWPAEANETCETWKWTICQMHLQDHRCQFNIWKCKWGRWQHACERGKPRETSHHVEMLFITIQELKLQWKEWKNISLNKGLHRLHWACALFCVHVLREWKSEANRWHSFSIWDILGSLASQKPLGTWNIMWRWQVNHKVNCRDQVKIQVKCPSAS